MKCQAFVPERSYSRPGQCDAKHGIQEWCHKGKKIKGLCIPHIRLLALNRLTLMKDHLANLEPARGINVRRKKISSLSKV